jgi:hypothetical protein
MQKSKEKELESERSYVDPSCPKCSTCHSKLRMVTEPIKMKCDECGIIYTINPYTGLIVSKFKSLSKVKQNDKTVD